MTRNSRSFALAAALVAAGGVLATSAHADVIAGWTFETSAPVTAGPVTPEVLGPSITASAMGVHAGASTYSSPAGNGSSHSFSSNTWAVGDYYEFDVTTASYTGLSLAFDATSSNTGPRDFKIQTSSDLLAWTDLVGGAFSVFANATPNPVWNATTSNSLYSLTFGLPDGIAGVRFVDDSTISANGGVVGTGGTSRIDNVVISGGLTPVPEPASLSLVAFGVMALLARRRR